ncbi:hypothetical protein CPB83DRAFT_872127 [Crepidotus variabilis]|uniref:DUF6830 domain-containing protein n=1 Tax=Crepidotus variabilis TaxID=179855 RepID=A0A9P6E3L5_9AGAR|nr:hypothetical protein CPB83DRAFT_872127 [Crepidotus variabilis]
MKDDVSGSVPVPFWADFPFTNIHNSLTLDVLHQLYQGVVKYLIEWSQTLLTNKELDVRIRALPPAYGVHHFDNGFSVLSQISDPEQKEMAKILLGCLVGVVPGDALVAFKALLDFIYLAQYKAHNNDTLDGIKTALNTFQQFKKHLIHLKLHDTLNIPKFHSLMHYIQAIKYFGTTDNYNTEAFERFHIDFAKEGYRASNKRDVFPQMVLWLSHREKISMFDNYLNQMDQPVAPADLPANRPLYQLANRPLHQLAKYPTFARGPISKILKEHNAPLFSQHLQEFLDRFLAPRTSNARSNHFPLLFDRLDVWTQFKFSPHHLQGYEEAESDTIKAVPRSTDNPHGRFNTVIVVRNDKAVATGVIG